MNRKEFIQKIEKNGCVLLRYGARHDIMAEFIERYTTFTSVTIKRPLNSLDDVTSLSNDASANLVWLNALPDDIREECENAGEFQVGLQKVLEKLVPILESASTVSSSSCESSEPAP